MPNRPSTIHQALLTIFVLLVALAAHVESRADFFVIGNDKINFEVAGSGFPLVLVSGGSGMDLRQWDRITPILAESYQVIRYDPRGIGQSDNPTERYSDTEDLRKLLDHLEVENTILIGLSSSAGFVLEYVLKNPSGVISVVAAAPFFPGFQFSDEMLARLQVFSQAAEAGKKPFLDSMFDDPYFIPAPLDRSIRSTARQNMGMNYDKSAGFDPGLPIPIEPPLIEQLSKISRPVLLLAGELDHPEVHRRNDFIDEEIPSSRQLVIPDSGHNAPLENPVAFLTAILPFLQEFSTR